MPSNEWTQARLDRYDAEGRGQGMGADYVPWIKVDEIPSLGDAAVIPGWKTNRPHHLLSKLEQMYFYIMEWSLEVCDIREQYPLLPVEEMIEIAKQCGIDYPSYPGTDIPVVFTTDFLVTVRKGLRETEYARTLKYARALHKQRTMEKFELELRRYRSRDIDWGIVTEKDIPMALYKNVERVHPYRSIDGREGLDEDNIPDIVEVVTRLVQTTDMSLRDIAAESDKLLALDRGVSLPVCYHLIVTRQWKINMHRSIDPSKKLNVLAVSLKHD